MLGRVGLMVVLLALPQAGVVQATGEPLLNGGGLAPFATRDEACCDIMRHPPTFAHGMLLYVGQLEVRIQSLADSGAYVSVTCWSILLPKNPLNNQQFLSNCTHSYGRPILNGQQVKMVCNATPHNGLGPLGPWGCSVTMAD